MPPRKGHAAAALSLSKHTLTALHHSQQKRTAGGLPPNSTQPDNPQHLRCRHQLMTAAARWWAHTWKRVWTRATDRAALSHNHPPPPTPPPFSRACTSPQHLCKTVHGSRPVSQTTQKRAIFHIVTHTTTTTTQQQLVLLLFVCWLGRSSSHLKRNAAHTHNVNNTHTRAHASIACRLAAAAQDEALRHYMACNSTHPHQCTLHRPPQDGPPLTNSPLYTPSSACSDHLKQEQKQEATQRQQQQLHQLAAYASHFLATTSARGRLREVVGERDRKVCQPKTRTQGQNTQGSCE